MFVRFFYLKLVVSGVEDGVGVFDKSLVTSRGAGEGEEDYSFILEYHA